VTSFLRSRLGSALVVVSVVLAACGGTVAAPTTEPVTPAPTAAVAATPAPTLAPTPAPTPAPYEFTSTGYGYRITLPGVSVATQRLQAWDGEARIDWVGPYTDQVLLPGSVRFFAYGAPTDLDLDAFSARIQEQSAEWHDCPAQPAEVTDLAIGQTVGRLSRMRCVGNAYIQKLVLVRDGSGLVVNLLAEPAVDMGEAEALFEELVAAMTWPA